MNITTNVVSSNSANGEVHSIQHYVITFVNVLQQVGGFPPITLVSSTNKTDCRDITELLLKVALNIIILSNLRPLHIGHTIRIQTRQMLNPTLLCCVLMEKEETHIL